MNITGKTGKSDNRNSYELKTMAEAGFIRSVYARSNKFFKINNKTQSSEPNEEVLEQIDAIKSTIQYVKQRRAEGLTINEINNELYDFMEIFMSSIKYPDLTNFYMLRTSEYMDGMDLTPYFEQIVNQKINIKEYARKNRESYSANLDKNILIEVCIRMAQLAEDSIRPKLGEYADFCNKIENNELTINDVPLMKKYFDLAYKELKLGRGNLWKKMRSSPEDLRKRFKQNIPNMYEFKDCFINNEPEKEEIPHNTTDIAELCDTPITASVLSSITKPIRNKKLAIFKPKYKSLFMGNDDDNNFILFMYELFELLTNGESPSDKELFMSNIHEMFIVSENAKDSAIREKYKEKMYEMFDFIKYNHTPLDIKQLMLIRIAKIVDFFEFKGELGKYCKLHNHRLDRVKLGKLQINEEDLFSKFIQNDKRKPLYFIEQQLDENQYYSSIVNQTPISRASEEAIIGMSGFYTNRLAKKAAKYSRILYICAQKNIIARAFYDEDFEYEDLDYTPEDIALMMSVCDEMRFRMKRQYYDKISPETFLYEEKEIDEITPILNNIKNAYNMYFSSRGFNFDFDRDLIYMIKDVKVTEKAYELKNFSVKSLIYTAMTDKNKNIINWGYVATDDVEDESKILIGFDIKGLNMPVYYHMDKENLVRFIKELTGGSPELPVYIGGDDMYSYALKQRLTTQILYPMSKDEKNKGLLKVDGYMASDPAYTHMRWLQQPNKPPYKNRASGDEMYNIETGETRKVTISKADQSKKKTLSSDTELKTTAGAGNVGSSNGDVRNGAKISPPSSKPQSNAKKKSKGKSSKSKSRHHTR